MVAANVASVDASTETCSASRTSARPNAAATLAGGTDKSIATTGTSITITRIPSAAAKSAPGLVRSIEETLPNRILKARRRRRKGEWVRPNDAEDLASAHCRRRSGDLHPHRNGADEGPVPHARTE